MKLKVFVKDKCPNCPAAKEMAKRFSISEIFNLDEPLGLAEAAFHSVLCTPSLILVDDSENVIEAWRCGLPKYSEITELIDG